LLGKRSYADPAKERLMHQIISISTARSGIMETDVEAILAASREKPICL
jgi:hypothetical protein